MEPAVPVEVVAVVAEVPHVHAAGVLDQRVGSRGCHLDGDGSAYGGCRLIKWVSKYAKFLVGICATWMCISALGTLLRRLMCTQGLEQGRIVLTGYVLVYVYMYTVKLEALPLGQGM